MHRASYKVLYLDAVETDIAEAKQWYAGQQKGLETRFAAVVKNTLGNIAGMPLSYAKRYKNVRIAHTKIFPYNIHFYVDEDKKQVVIIGIVHNRRNDALFLNQRPQSLISDEEDAYLSRIADQNEDETDRYYSSEEAWGRKGPTRYSSSRQLKGAALKGARIFNPGECQRRHNTDARITNPCPCQPQTYGSDSPPLRRNAYPQGGVTGGLESPPSVRAESHQLGRAVSPKPPPDSPQPPSLTPNRKAPPSTVSEKPPYQITRAERPPQGSTGVFSNLYSGLKTACANAGTLHRRFFDPNTGQKTHLCYPLSRVWTGWGAFIRKTFSLDKLSAPFRRAMPYANMRKGFVLRSKAFATFATLFLAFSIHAATYYVDPSRPNDGNTGLSWATAKRTLPAAIEGAVTGDEIIVTNGIYGVISTTKSITIRSVNGAEVTIIDGGGTSRCATLGAATILTGFTLRNGYVAGTSSYGGGVSGGTLNDCILSGNVASAYDNTTFVNAYAYAYGGGAYNCTLNNCTLTGNGAVAIAYAYLFNTYVYAYGGGAYICTLNNCTLSGNYVNAASPSSTSDAYARGGGAYNSILKNCILKRNSADSFDASSPYPEGGGTYGGTLNNCTLSENTAFYGGGSHSGTLNNCVLSGNTASKIGGGSYNGTLNNCTLSGNTATWYGGGSNGGTVNNCIVWGNFIVNGIADNYCGGMFNYSCTTPLPSGIGNIDQNPLFLNATSGNFRLQANSPCIDGGSNAYASGAFDLDGNPRIQGGIVDMGAYEFKPPVIYTVTFDGQGAEVSPDSKIVTQGETYGELPDTTRTGYAFEGWHTAVNGGGTEITETSVVTLPEAHTLYAYWVANTYTVAFDAQGGVVSPGSKSVTFGGGYGELPIPTNTGWYFGGWYNAPSGGIVVKSSSLVTTAGNHTLYAHWTDTPPSYLSDPRAQHSGTATITTAYSGFGYDTNYTVRGTVTLNAKAAVKLNKKTGLATTNWTFSAKVSLQSSTVSFSGKKEGVADRFTVTTRTSEKLDVFVEGNRFYGTVSGGKIGGAFFVDGARSAFADKKDLAAQGRLDRVRGLYNVALLECGGSTPLFGGGGGAESGVKPPHSIGYVSLSVGNLGSVKIAGSLADGTRVSGSAKLLEGLNEEGWYAMTLFSPLYSKKGFVGGLLWLDPVSKVIRVDTDYEWFVDWVREADPKKPTEPAFAYELDVLGGYFGTGQNTPLPPRGLKFVLGDSSLLEATDLPGLTGAWVTNALPWALDVRYDTTGLKLTLDKGIAPKIPKGETDYDYNVTNPSGATLTYTPKTGIFKGSFKTYFDGLDNKTGKPQHKVFTVPYTGLMVPDGGSLTGMGIGTATINKQKIPIPVYLTVW